MHASDYKKIDAKLKSLCPLTFLLLLFWQEFVPCVLLSFDDEQILMWRGRDWTFMYGEALLTLLPAKADTSSGTVESAKSIDDSRTPDAKKVISSPKMRFPWKLPSSQTRRCRWMRLLLVLILFWRRWRNLKACLTTEHSCEAVVLSSEDGFGSSMAELEDGSYGADFGGENDIYSDDDIINDEYYDVESLEELDSSTPLGSLPVDRMAERLRREGKGREGKGRSLIKVILLSCNFYCYLFNLFSPSQAG
ncbi:hypothetical protein CRYUN_Cryun29cG0051500 [Craigia yunnanensis]